MYLMGHKNWDGRILMIGSKIYVWLINVRVFEDTDTQDRSFYLVGQLAVLYSLILSCLKECSRLSSPHLRKVRSHRPT